VVSLQVLLRSKFWPAAQRKTNDTLQFTEKKGLSPALFSTAKLPFEMSD